MTAPDIAYLLRQIQLEEALASEAPDPHDDHQEVARARSRDAQDRAAALKHQVAAMEAQRKADLAAIHAQAKRAGIDEETRRAMIWRISQGRTGSSGELMAGERAELLRELGLPGAAQDRFPGTAAGRPGIPAIPGHMSLPKPALVSAEQWNYLCDLARKLHLDDRSFTRLVRHITGLEDPAWLDVPRARRLIAGLIRIEAAPAARKRVPARGNPADPRTAGRA